jgi:hypothetical protein
MRQRSCRRLLEAQIDEVVAIAMRILDGGLDDRQIPRYTAITKQPDAAALAAANAKRDAEIEKRQRQWLAKSGHR